MYTYNISWPSWILILGILIVIYFALNILNRIFNQTGIWGKQSLFITNLIRKLLKIYEPVAFIVLIVAFVFIHPYVNGLIVLLLLIFCFNPFKNYMSGRLFLVSQNLKGKEEIKAGNVSGIITKFGKFGVQLQAQDGLHFINYHSLLSDGYSLLKSKKVARLYELRIEATDEIKSINQQTILNKLFFCPYIDWSMKPKLKALNQEHSLYTLEVQVRKEKHAQYLTSLINEWGYKCKLAK